MGGLCDYRVSSLLRAWQLSFGNSYKSDIISDEPIQKAFYHQWNLMPISLELQLGTRFLITLLLFFLIHTLPALHQFAQILLPMFSWSGHICGSSTELIALMMNTFWSAWNYFQLQMVSFLLHSKLFGRWKNKSSYKIENWNNKDIVSF